MQILNKHKPKSNNFFSQELKQSYNYQAQSIIQKKNFFQIDNRFNKKNTPFLEQRDRVLNSKIEFYQQQLKQINQINENYVEKLVTSEIELKQYHFDVIKLNQQINNLERINMDTKEKCQNLEKQTKQNQTQLQELQKKIKNVQSTISKLYTTITSSQDNTYKDLEYIFSTDSNVQKQLQAICYVMLQCCRQNNMLRKALSEQDSIITKLDHKTTAAYIRSNFQLEANNKLFTDYDAHPSVITFQERQDVDYRLSPFKTPYKSIPFQVQMRQSRGNRTNIQKKSYEYNLEKERQRKLEYGRDWQKNKIKSQLRQINVEIDRLQSQLMQQMKH